MSEQRVRRAMADAYLTLGEALGSVHELEATIIRLRDRIVLATTMYETGMTELPDEQPRPSRPSDHGLRLQRRRRSANSE